MITLLKHQKIVPDVLLFGILYTKTNYKTSRQVKQFYHTQAYNTVC